MESIFNLLKLKSGSDVRGVALPGVEGEEVNLTDDVIRRICNAFIVWLYKRYDIVNPIISIGHDSRLSAERILNVAVETLLDSGANVRCTGLCSTPSMFMILKNEANSSDACIMITASHMPFNKNGLKFFTAEGGLNENDIVDILTLANQDVKIEDNSRGTCITKSFMDIYSKALVEKVEKACGKLPLLGKKIIVDAGNGAGGFFVEKVLKPLGADTDGSLYLEPDGAFPNHIPNPEDKAAMECICRQVEKTGADFGIIFDTDVDRAGAVAKGGKEINRNRLIALISAILLSESKGTIVTDSVTSDGLTTFIESLGGNHLRYKRGYKNVIEKSMELNDSGEYSPLAIETSGHAAFKENYFLDDGAYLITRLLIALSKQAKEGKDLMDLIANLPEPIESDEVRIGFKEGVDFKTLGFALIEKLKNTCPLLEGIYLLGNDYEGVRIHFKEEYGDGFTLLRMSVHDPVIPINFESNTRGGNRVMAKRIFELLSAYPYLNLQNLSKFID